MGRGAPMARMLHKRKPGEQPGAWLGIAKFLGLLLMFVLFFLLAQSMVRHHFFTGGAQDNHNAPTGP
jgi:hypothetical protein